MSEAKVERMTASLPMMAAWPRGQLMYGTLRPYPEWPEAVVSIGTFDGVHLGHQTVIETAAARARQTGRPSGIVTFDRHPAELLAPERAPKALASLGEKLRLLLDLGPEFVLVLPFDERLRDTSADDFLEQILRRKARAIELVIGHDFAMGHAREGTPDWLSKRIPTIVVPPREVDGERVSSSMVRQVIQAGDVEKATTLLGRPYAIEGVVVEGLRLGRELGYPTANLARLSGLTIPADGVYAARTATPFGSYATALSIGTRPTIDGTSQLAIEAYLLDYPGESLYGRLLRVEISKFLRPQERFDDLEALKEQIASDVAEVRKWDR